MFQSLYQMRCDTNTIRFISLIIVLTIILCLIDWIKYGDNAKHHSAGNSLTAMGNLIKRHILALTIKHSVTWIGKKIV